MRTSGWYINYIEPSTGKRRRVAAGCSTRAEAIKKEQELVLGRTLGGLKAMNVKSDILTLGQAFNKALDGLWHDSKSINDMIYNVKLAERFFGEGTPLTDITTAKISAYTEHLQSRRTRAGKIISTSTVNRKLATLRAMLTEAHKFWEVLPNMPAFRMGKENKGRMRLMSDSEESLLLSKATPEMNALLTVLLGTGCRLSEALKLTAKDIDLVNGYVSFWDTKDGKYRTVPIPSDTKAVFIALKLKDGIKIGNKHQAEREWNKLKAHSGINDASLVLHVCRHTYATRQLIAGNSIYDVQKLLGHASVTTTERYAKVIPSHLLSVMQKYDHMRSQKSV
jgi:integrase